MTEDDGALRGRSAHADLGHVDVISALAGGRIAAWHWDREAGLRWSPDAADVLSVPAIVLHSPELLQRAVDPNDMALVGGAVRRAWRDGGRVNARIRATILDGRSRWFDVIGRVLRDEEGGATGATGVALEVTENHEAGEAIVEALKEAQDALERLRLVVGEWDPSCDMVSVARQARELTLVAEPPGSLSLTDFLARTGAGDAPRVRRALEAAFDQGVPFAMQLPVQDDDGETRQTLLRGGATDDSRRRVWIAMVLLE